MKALVIARVSMLRTLRDRMGLFFIVVLPLLLITVLGLTYGGMNSVRIGVADLDGGRFATDLVSGIQTEDLKLDIRRYGSEADLRDAVERGFIELGIVIEPGYDAALRAGGTGRIEYVGQVTSVASVTRAPIDAAIARQQGLVQAARYVAQQRGMTFDAALAAVRPLQDSVGGVGVAVERIGETSSSPSGYTVGAESQVILFMFLTSMTGAATIVSTRQLGVSRREFSTPTSAGTIVLGETLGRLGFALFQGFFIVVASGLLFGVDWGDPAGMVAIVLAFALVSSGAAMLVATLASNENQVGSIGVALGMILALLGGTMVPLEVFPPFMRTLSHVAPHSWAVEAFHRLTEQGGGVVDIVPELAVLLGFAVALLAVASWRFRRIITTGGV